MKRTVKTNRVKKPEIVINRTFEAPRELVWKAWTDPEQAMRWWGPKNFTAPVCRMDLRVGGKYLMCMRSPEGKDYWSTGVYKEIIQPSRIVSTDTFADAEGNVVPASYYGMKGNSPVELLVTATFADKAGKTLLTLRHAGMPGAKMREMAKIGWNESLDKLEQTLLQLRTESEHGTRILAEPGKQELVITHIFEAPREVVFRAYTDPKLIPQWWGPSRYTTIIDKLDVKPGSSWRFVQHDSKGAEYSFHGVYHQVAQPEQLVYTFEFEGMPGHVLLETVKFTEEAGGKTRVVESAVFQTVEDRDGMLDSDMKAGAIETMERLDKLLARSEKFM